MRRLTTAVAIIATSVLVLASCGDESDSSGQGGAANSGGATANNLTAAPIKLGLATALSGPASVQGTQAADASEAWAAYTNANGGIDGHPVEIDIVDSKGDPAAMLAAVTKFTEQDKVSAIMIDDPVSESAAGDYTSSHNMPVIGVTGFDTAIYSALPNYFNTGTTIPQTVQASATITAGLGLSTLGAVVCAEIAGCKQAGEVLEPAADEYDLSYGGLVTASASKADYTAECLALMDEGTDSIFASLTADVVNRFITNCQQQGYDGYYLAIGGTYNQSYLSKAPAGAKIAGGLDHFPWWADDPQVQTYRDAMEKYSPDGDLTGSNATGAWSALELFKKAVGTPPETGLTPELVMEGYWGLDNETLGGLLAQPANFAKGEPAPKDLCFYGYEYTPGDDQPVSKAFGESGNGASGDLQSSCVSAS